MTKPKTSSTECVHAGAKPVELSGPIITPIVHCAPFAFDSTAEVIKFQEGRSERRQPEYGRMGNPTVVCVESRLAALEGAERAILFSSGMAAITSLLLTVLKSGDHVVMTRDAYRRTREFTANFMKKFGVEVTLVEPSLCAIENAVCPATRMIFSESPTNPYLNVMDVEGLGRSGREHGVLTAVDSTFATPFNIRPIEFGIDLILHSATKYLGGHNDLIAGYVAGREELLQPLSGFWSAWLVQFRRVDAAESDAFRAHAQSIAVDGVDGLAGGNSPSGDPAQGRGLRLFPVRRDFVPAFRQSMGSAP